MSMVWPCPLTVEEYAELGRAVLVPRPDCPSCGARMTFWGGGIDAQRILPFVSAREVRDEVHRNLDIFKTGGGYVFNNVHNIQQGVPPENIVALFDAAYEFGFYD